MSTTTHRQPLLLDLFCGAGGAAMGYHRAGFDVVGVDIEPQPRYPFEFVQWDALALPGYRVGGLLAAATAAVHASPPCQAYSIATGSLRAAGKQYADLLAKTRRMLNAIGRPWVIENVPGAPMRADVVLCGSQFALPGLIRHRWFEFGGWEPPFTLMEPCAHRGRIVTVMGNGDGSGVRWWRDGNLRPKGVTWSQLCRQAMGIDWMSRDELSQAIPPAYTEWIGSRLLAVALAGSGDR